MRKFTYIPMVLLLILTTFILAAPEHLLADTSYTDSTSNCQAVIEDHADLLSDAEETKLLNRMIPIAQYYDIGIVTISDNPYGNAYTYTQNYNEELFDNGDSILFVIDMDERELVLDGMNAAGKIISTSVSNTITDNIYTYASDADYYTCCYKAIQQIHAKVQGKHINQPMKYLSNALLAIILAMLINYFVVMAFSRKHKPSKTELLSGIFNQVKVHNAKTVFTNQTKTYSPQSSGSSGSHSGGGGHSGGGSSHSSGGHHF